MDKASSIVVDWGSSSFRAFLLSSGGEILDRVSSADGAFQTSDYENVLSRLCGKWLEEQGKLPFLLGGTIGSRNGWLETPYIPCPVSLPDLRNGLYDVPNNLGLGIRVASGVCGSGIYGSFDVMRGEEIQIFGAIRLLDINRATFCLPGTHSKWCETSNGAITSVTSYMTGEMYALIRQHSSIGRLIDAEQFDEPSFMSGVAAAQENSDLLNLLFSVRAGALLGKLEVNCLASYLSGALIGSELNAATRRQDSDAPLVVIATQQLTERYCLVFEDIGLSVQVVDGEQAFLQGAQALMQEFELAL